VDYHDDHISEIAFLATPRKCDYGENLTRFHPNPECEITPEAIFMSISNAASLTDYHAAYVEHWNLSHTIQIIPSHSKCCGCVRLTTNSFTAILSSDILWNIRKIRFI
jgi:hypothetical protein